MRRIATANRELDKFGPGKDGFRAAVPGVSEATSLSADFFNELQESVVQTIESAGLVPASDNGQLAAAVTKLASPDNVTFAQVGSGAVERPVLEKLREWVSILDYGGAADGVTDNTDALTKLRNAGYSVVRFPRTPDGGNTYYFSGALTASLTEGVTLDPERGVTINVLDIGYIDPSAKVTCDTHLYLSALQEDYWMTPCSHAQPASRPVWMSYADRDTSVLSPIACNSLALSFKQVTSGQDTFTTFVPTFASISGIIIPIENSTDYRAGLKRMVPGEEISAQFSDSTNATPVAIIRTATSYYGMAADKTDTAQPQTFAKAVSGGTSVVPITYLGMGEHASYAAWKSVWTIRVNTVRNFSILFTGVEVVSIDTDDEIIEAGFGGQGSAGGSITIVDWVSETGKPAAAARPINIAFFGDSITAHTFNGSWPTQLVNLLDQHYGLRVNFIQNYAVSGASTTTQLPLCTSANIASYDVVCIMLGPNDIQGGTTEQDYAANLTTMINTCKAAGKKLVVGLPPMFYGQGQAGAGKGQATQNYDLGKGIRAKCLRTCADLGVPVVNTWGHMGPILADWVNPTLNSLANLGRDPMVFDSIHPTQFGKLVLARAFAAKIAGLFMRTPTLRTSLADLPASNLSNGFAFSAQPPQWIRDDAGKAKLCGFILRGATIVNNTEIYTMPENIRPFGQTARFQCAADTGTCWVQIDSVTGQVSIFGYPADAAWISLDNISYPTR